MTDAYRYSCNVNGSEAVLLARPVESVVEVLRRELRLFSVRETCGIGVCGTCTILLDGEPVSSCLLPVFAIEGRDVVTVEGLGDSRMLDEVQQAFIDEQAFQCSFCTPGFILSTKRMVEAETPLTDEAIHEYLSGHLCRCGSYEFIKRAAIAASARHLEPARSPEKPSRPPSPSSSEEPSRGEVPNH